MDFASAAPDSAAVAGAVAPFIASLLGKFAGLDPKFAALATSVATASVVTLALALWRKGLGWLAAVSPEFDAHVAPLWDRWKGVLNPLLALLAGWGAGGNPLFGVLSVFLHSTQRGVAKAVAKTTPQGISKGKGAIALLAILGALSIGGPASAQEPAAKPAAKPYSLLEHVTFAAGGGTRRQFGPGKDFTGFIGGALGYQWTDHFATRMVLKRDLKERPDSDLEVSLWLTF